MNTDDEVRRLEAQWQELESAWRQLHARFFSSGTGPVQRPPEVLTEAALNEIIAARQTAEAAYRRWIEALRP